MSNDKNRNTSYDENRFIRNGKTQTIKGVGTTKVTRDKFSENTTTYMTRNNSDKKQGN
ncbi:hypothetical protein P5815_03035 [Bacillus cereus]|uniref:hypothetical protein n=1 Tax=Bacillus TaxID=1386 RepID=UPI001483217C|nr:MULTISPECIES: hypothetical protein [Bacillus cereus group]MBJ7951404.1 hypothetical protein [Bacillus cereus]MBX9155624.1 hypothetical protein [Bacillus cereus]MDF9519547.1 hypothetical protein [Bacillus cereus]MDF9564960.1 hypothetical protein [Bacillus cereus]MDZ4452965.1 hypothetical protein [Bacillus cereus]